MRMNVSEAVRIRVVRAFLGMDSKSFAARLGTCAASVTNWEKGRTTPTPRKRKELEKLCETHRIWFSPEGWPFPAGCVFPNQKTEEGE